jgi:hypothetical protein
VFFRFGICYDTQVEPGAIEVASRRAPGQELQESPRQASRSRAGSLSEGHLLLRRPRVAKAASWVAENPGEFRLGQGSRRTPSNYRLSR